MQYACFYLLIFLHIAEGCELLDYTQLSMTVSSGESAVLPCSCADPQDKAPNLSWHFRKKGLVSFDAIYPSDETKRYRGRVQLVNGEAPGNFTLLISHLTAEDGGDYQCRVNSNYRFVFLTVKAPPTLSETTASTARPGARDGCKFSDYRQVFMTVSSGESAVLPCSCADPQDKAPNLSWDFRKKDKVFFDAVYPSDETNRYRGRVQLVNGEAPGDFTLLISHLTAEDDGAYRCQDKNNIKLVFLTVKAPPTLSETTASTARPDDKNSTHYLTSGARDVPPEPLPFVPFAVVTVVFLHIIVAVVYCSTRKKAPAKFTTVQMMEIEV